MSNSIAIRDVCQAITTPQFRDKLAASLPPGVSLTRFERVTLTALQQNPGLVGSVDRNSLYMAVCHAAECGLEPNGREGAIVKMGNRAQFMPMIGGLRKIAGKHGILIDAQIVHQGDEFKVWRDETGPHFRHEPGESQGDMVKVYAIARLPDGQVMLEVMSRADVEAVRKTSRAANNGPWVSHYGEMARKTCARRLWKQLPLITEDDDDSRVIDNVVRHADAEFIEAEFVDAVPAADSTPVGKPSVLDKVAATVDDEPSDTNPSEAHADDPF